MSQPILLDFYRQLPERHANEKSRAWWKRFHEGMDTYRQAVQGRYNEGTLERLLDSRDAEVRQAAVTALGMLGSMRVNQSIARLLHDDDATIRKLAEEALWSLWFWAGGSEHHEMLQQLMRMNLKNEGADKILAGFDTLIQKAPHFAEAFNQRAIFYFRMGKWELAIADCARVLKLNPYHFGAAGGLAQCSIKQRKYRAALRAYRRALRIHPYLDGVLEAIQSLERQLDEEGRK